MSSNIRHYYKLWTPIHRTTSGHFVFFGFIYFIYDYVNDGFGSYYLKCEKHVSSGEFLLESLRRDGMHPVSEVPPWGFRR